MNLDYKERRIARLLVSNGTREKLGPSQRADRYLEREIGITGSNHPDLDFRHPEVILERAKMKMDGKPKIAESRVACDVDGCKFTGFSENGLAVHKARIHGIPTRMSKKNKKSYEKKVKVKSANFELAELADIAAKLDQLYADEKDIQEQISYQWGRLRKVVEKGDASRVDRTV